MHAAAARRPRLQRQMMYHGVRRWQRARDAEARDQNAQRGHRCCLRSFSSGADRK